MTTDRKPERLFYRDIVWKDGKRPPRGVMAPAKPVWKIHPDAAAVVGCLPSCYRSRPDPGHPDHQHKALLGGCDCGHRQLRVLAVPGPVGAVMCRKGFPEGVEDHGELTVQHAGGWRLLGPEDQPIREAWELWSTAFGAKYGLYCFHKDPELDDGVLLPVEDATKNWLGHLRAVSSSDLGPLDAAQGTLLMSHPNADHLLFRLPGREFFYERENVVDRKELR